MTAPRSSSATTPAPVFSWEKAVQEDGAIKLLDQYVRKVLSKFPGDATRLRADGSRGGSRYQSAPAAATVPAAVKPERGALSLGDACRKCWYLYMRRGVTARVLGPSTHSGIEPMRPSPPVAQGAHTMATTAAGRATDTQFINVRDYQSESSSEMDTREVNPMDELSDFEGEATPTQQPPQQQKRPEPPVVEPQQPADEGMDGNEDVDMGMEAEAEAEGEDEEEAEQTACEVCKRSDKWRQTILCDDCNADPEKSNSLLVHACSCDEAKCTSLEFQMLCPHMKRFLRSVCWASHSEKWRSYRLAKVTAELFAYHSMHCKLARCNVPLCDKIREEEIV
ncbi:hypothetical protein BBJ28_00016369 [Nothophytophthora sp. Chile5]|nr:hypothetical protein BBJ28_00016369 [Nothophytophthora sp. Chile5]